MLLRSALDDWLAERYVKSNPEEVSRWVDHALPPPKRSTRMRCLSGQDRARLQEIFHTLDDFEHPGRLGVWSIVEPGPTGGYLRMGGHFDARELRLVIAPFLHTISSLHNSLQELTSDIGLEPWELWCASAKDFDHEAGEWLKQFNAEATGKQRVRADERSRQSS